MGHRHNRKRTRSRSRNRRQSSRSLSPDLTTLDLGLAFDPPSIPVARSAYVPRVYEPLFTPAAPASVLAAASVMSHSASQPDVVSSGYSPSTARELLLCTSFKHQSLCMPAERRGQQDGWAAAQDSVRYLFDGDMDFIDAAI